jgi:hypothetical protein
LSFIVFLLSLFGGWRGRGGSRGGGGQQIEHGAVLGLEAAALGRGEAFAGDGEGGQVEQGLVRSSEPLFEPCAQRGESWRFAGIGAHRAQRLCQQGGALGLRGHAEGGEQGEGLLGGQAAPLRRTQDGLLLRSSQRAQRVGEGGAELVVIDLVAQGGRELAGEDETARHPAWPAAGGLPHLRLGLPVLPDEGVHHARLVHGGQAAGRCVGAEEQDLLLHRGGGLLDDGGDLGMPRAHPLREALEAVEDLERAVVSARHAQRHLPQHGRRLCRRRRARAQGSQARA